MLLRHHILGNVHLPDAASTTPATPTTADAKHSTLSRAVLDPPHTLATPCLSTAGKMLRCTNQRLHRKTSRNHIKGESL